MCLFYVILGLLQSCSRSQSVLFDGFNLFAAPHGIENRRWKICVRIELNAFVLQNASSFASNRDKARTCRSPEAIRTMITAAMKPPITSPSKNGSLTSGNRSLSALRV